MRIRGIKSANSPEPEQEIYGPVPDTFGPPVFPYRGSETHGVEPNEEIAIHERDMVDGTVSVEFDEDKAPKVEPVPVIIVTESRNEFNRWAVNRSFAPANTEAPQRVVARDATRTGCRVRNVGTQTVYVAPEANLADSRNGYPIAINTDFELEDSTAEIWAGSSDGSVQGLAILLEYVSSR